MSKVAPAPDYADEINRAYANGCAKAKAAIADIKLCGDLLIAQKARMKHGEFIPWVKANCTFSHDSANVYMRVALDPNYEHARNLSLREFLEKPKRLPAATEDLAERSSGAMQRTTDERKALDKPLAQTVLPSTPTSDVMPDKLLHCSFCGKSQHEVRKLIAGPCVYICNECVGLCNDIIREEEAEEEARKAKAAKATPKPPAKATPKTKAKRKPTTAPPRADRD